MTSHACCLKYVTLNGHTGWHLFEDTAITPILTDTTDGKVRCDRLTEILDFAYQVSIYEPYIASKNEVKASNMTIATVETIPDLPTQKLRIEYSTKKGYVCY